VSHAGTEDKFLKTLFPPYMEGLRVLDVGHGYGQTGLYIRTRTYKTGWCELYGVEPFKEYHDLMKRTGIYDHLEHGLAETMMYEDGFFDLSIAQHVVEHCDREAGLSLLRNMERVTSGRVIICTPDGYTESGALDGNEHNHHLSGWSVKDFADLGYETRVVTKNVNSRLLVRIAELIFRLRGKRWDNKVIVAWKDV